MSLISFHFIQVVPDNVTLWTIEDMKLATPDTPPVVYLNLWLYSVGAKLIPCVLMVVYGGLLLSTLRNSLRSVN